MEQHAVPRQITTFEFKLIGFLTIKQFAYLIISGGIATIAFFLVRANIINFLVGGVVFGLGAFFTLFKYNERNLDTWIVNLSRALMDPSQYYYHKQNHLPAFLQYVSFYQQTGIPEIHADANKKLSTYLQSPNATSPQNVDGPTAQEKQKSQDITQLLHTVDATSLQLTQTDPASRTTTVIATPTQDMGPIDTAPSSNSSSQTVPNTTPATPTKPSKPSSRLKVATPAGKPAPFISGLVKNNKNELLTGILLYILDPSNQTIRILKTNQQGIFATFSALPNGTYTLSPKDTTSRYFFDTMKLEVDGSPIQPITIFSREIL